MNIPLGSEKVISEYRDKKSEVNKKSFHIECNLEEILSFHRVKMITGGSVLLCGKGKIILEVEGEVI